MMNIRRTGRWTTWLLAAVLVVGATGTAQAFEPWSKVSEYWVAGDGLTVIEDAVEKGITVSKYQNMAGTINWKKVVLDDISFVMVRLGYYEDMDPYFESNMEGAAGVGLKTGVCFYGSAVGEEEARQEAKYVLNQVKEYRVSYPIGYHVDFSELQKLRLSKHQITEQISAFCGEIEEAGYPVVVFGDYDGLRKYVDIRKLRYDIWYDRLGVNHNFPNRMLWRGTERGQAAGVEGQVCLEFSFDNYEEIFPAEGWRKIDGEDYYFINHRIVKDKTLKINGDLYLFDKDGKATMRNNYIRGGRQ